ILILKDCRPSEPARPSTYLPAQTNPANNHFSPNHGTASTDQTNNTSKMGCTHSTLRRSSQKHKHKHTTNSTSPYPTANPNATFTTNNVNQRKQKPHTPLHHPSRLLHSLSTLSLSHAAYAADVFDSDSDDNDGDNVDAEGRSRPVNAVRVVWCADDGGEGGGTSKERGVRRIVSAVSLRGKEDGEKEKEKEEERKREREREREKERQMRRVGLPRRASLPSIASCGDLRREYKVQERRMREREREEREALCIREE
ncbi:hypothetical protein JOL62DRAFT_621716, partial [Phyllosticta paracitricarpa]